MALFNRKKKESVLPEIDKYYDGERRDRAGLAWVLALVSVIAVTLIVVGLFLAGRWAYRAVTDDNNDVAVVENTDETAPNFDGGSSSESESGSETPAPSDNGDSADEGDSEPAPAPAPESDAPAASEQGTVDAPAQTNTPSTPITGDDPLPSTGPANVIAVFAGVSTITGGAHYAVTRKRADS